MNMKTEKKLLLLRNLLFLAGGIVLLLTLAFQGGLLYFESGKKQLQTENDFEQFSETDSSEILWNGDVYAYKEELINILILGIDGRGKAEKNEYFGFGPRADSIYLAVVNPSQGSMEFINISRDIITPIKMYDSLGQDMGNYPMQIGLQYCNGDGLEGSCQLMESAVSNLLGNIPIHGYCALYWNGITEIHEAVGPVTVNVPEYLVNLDFVTFEKSGMTELSAEQAKIYVQCRDINITGSDELRRQRQKEYFEALYDAAKKKISENPLSVLKIRDRIEPYLVTDLDTKEMLTLAYWLTTWDVRNINIKSIPGETVTGMFQDEYIVDQEQLQELMIQNFYEKRY